MIRNTVERRIGALLKGTGQTLSAAESCTGGRISHLITTVSGSSAYYLGSVTSYAVKIKEKVLSVPSETISSNGVVSSEVACAMAEGVRALFGSTYSVATTGLAEGGDEHYPEGTVWIAVSGPLGTESTIYQSGKGVRKDNIRQFTCVALQFLEKYIQKSQNIDNQAK